jgi:putative transposase
MKKYRGVLSEARAKIDPKTGRLEMQCVLPLAELVAGIRADVEAMSAEVGLKIMSSVIEHELGAKLGAWGSQAAYRHGRQAGFVVFAGRKHPLERPRLRAKDGGELPVESYRAFQEDGRMQRAVARKLIRQVSCRNYAGAIDDCLEGYGIRRSSVSRHWKAVTAAELAKLQQRPVPSDLLVLLIDGKHFQKDCVVVAIGIDTTGTKHVLGLWHGATENATVARELLADLRDRGLKTEAAMLVVLDGSKALRKAVGQVLGDAALVQRCRVHKARNVIEHLSKDKQQQALWRLRAAWAKENFQDALKELQATARWLEPISPSAAASLREGMEETLTVTKLGLPKQLAQSFWSTNIIESCFSQAEKWTRRVTRWRNGKMVMRWAAAALLVAEAGFRRVKGHRHIGRLAAALKNLNLEEESKAA